MRYLSVKNISLVVFLSGASQSAVAADVFSITNRTYGTVPLAFQSEVDAIFDDLETQVNAAIPAADTTTYLKGIANSAVIGGSGMGVDYASPFKFFIFSGNLGAGVDLGNVSLSDLISGTAAATDVVGAPQAAITIGMNVGSVIKKSGGLIDFSRMKGFIGFLSSSTNQQDVSATFSSFSLMGQYKLVPEKSIGARLIRWGGVDVSGGYRYSSLNISAVIPIQQSSASTMSTPGNPTLTTTFDGDLTLGADVGSSTLPLEISSSFRVLYIFNFFGGFGADFSFGSAQNITTVAGPVTAVDSLGALGTIGGDADLNLGSNQGPSFTSLRSFIGVQLELAVMAASFQFTKSITNGTMGGNFGLKVFF